MTLRLRLVLGLLTLLAVGLIAFGVATSSLYARSQYRSLDSQMRSASQFVTQQVEQQMSGSQLDRGPGEGGRGGGEPHPAGGPKKPQGDIAPGGTYALLLSGSGKVLARWSSYDRLGRAKLRAGLRGTPDGTFSTVGATSGPTKYRVLAISAPDPDGGRNASGDTVAMIAPTSDVVSSITRLVAIETIGGAILLLLVSAGAWIVLRRELRPLERMARAARTMTAGDLSQRMSTAGPAEVGQLGLALNTMLADIETAFRQREATELRLRQFLADASHELRTPLTSIQGFAELFRVGGTQAQVDLPTILRRIEQEAGRMSLLVDDLLLLARLDQARPIVRLPIDLAVLAADTCSDLVALAPDRSVTLEAPEPVIVSGDEHHLRQALSNLAVNAVRHTPEGTPIEVSARQIGDTGVVAVRDHGAGLSAEAKAKAFDRFWQADRARVGPGVGLGLAIVAGVAAEHEGKAEVNDVPGGGAAFSLHLPLLTPEGEVPANPAPDPGIL